MNWSKLLIVLRSNSKLTRPKLLNKFEEIVKKSLVDNTCKRPDMAVLQEMLPDESGVSNVKLSAGAKDETWFETSFRQGLGFGVGKSRVTT